MLFNLILKNKLIFNTCWEDPAIDRALYNTSPDSNLLTITSAGCNALEYLLDNPKEVNCCDINPAQNSVLELKIALFREGNYENLWEFFGKGGTEQCEEIYYESLEQHLSHKAQEYWSKNLSYFTGKRSYYRRGASGKASTVFMTYLKSQKKLNQAIEDLFNAETLEEQEKIFNRVEDKLWTNFTKMLLDNYLIHYLLGVPRNQYKVAMQNDSSLYTYIKNHFKTVFTKYPARENHFWKVYFYGVYDDYAKPGYLKKENYETIKSRIDRVKVNYCPLQDILESKDVTHINLLDHQDWHIGKNDYIKELWTKIIEKESLGQVLMRTASPVFELPEEIREKFDFTDQSEIELGMVGTYYQTIHAVKK